MPASKMGGVAHFIRETTILLTRNLLKNGRTAKVGDIYGV